MKRPEPKPKLDAIQQKEIDDLHEQYEEEIELFAEFELEVFIDEMIEDTPFLTEDQVMRCIGFIAQHGTNTQWAQRLQGYRFMFQGIGYYAGYIKGKTPVEIAWRLYRITDENAEKPAPIRRVREAMLSLDASDVDGHGFSPFDDDDPDRNWHPKLILRRIDPLLTEGAKIRALQQAENEYDNYE